MTSEIQLWKLEGKKICLLMRFFVCLGLAGGSVTAIIFKTLNLKWQNDIQLQMYNGPTGEVKLKLQKNCGIIPIRTIT